MQGLRNSYPGNAGSTIFLARRCQTEIKFDDESANSFGTCLNRRQRPPVSSIVYDGIFNEHYFKSSTTEQLLEPFGHCALDRFGNLFLGVEVVSVLDGKARDPAIPLDLTLVIDISGSMGSKLAKDAISKLEATKGFVVELYVCSRQLLNSPDLIHWKGMIPFQ